MLGIAEDVVEERRHRALTDADIERLAQSLHDHQCCTPEEHNAQHEVLSRWIENDNKRRERNERIREQVGGWAIIAILGSFGKGVYEAFIYLKEHLK